MKMNTQRIHKNILRLEKYAEVFCFRWQDKHLLLGQ